jgi:1-phosphofructokinase
MIITINLNPALDKTVEIPNFEAGAVNRVLSLRLDAGGKGINVSKAILSLGGKSRAVGILGGVGNGLQPRRKLELKQFWMSTVNY